MLNSSSFHKREFSSMMSGSQCFTCDIQIRVQLNHPEEIFPFLTTGNLLVFPFIRALNREMW